MCLPTYYEVSYEINPWMINNKGQTETDLARKQWADLTVILADYFDVTIMFPQPGLPDLVFTANAGFVLGKKAVVSKFKTKERQGEEKFFDVIFRNNGFDVIDWPANVIFEGAGDALLDRKKPIIWAGYGFRTEIAAHNVLADIFQREVLSLRLVDDRFYHLDTCLCPLYNGYMLYYPEAFDKESQKRIKDNVEPEKLIPVGHDDAFKFCCNAVNAGKHLFLHDCSQELQDKLKDNGGFHTHLTPLSEFLKAGGTAKCLTLKLDES